MDITETKPLENEKVTSSLLHIKTVLRRERKMPIKNYIMPFACVGPISDTEKEMLAAKLREMGYSVSIESSIFSASSHMRIDWTDKNFKVGASLSSMV